MTTRMRANLAPAHERILGFLQANGEAAVSAATVGALTGCSTSHARHRLEALVRRGKAVRDGDLYRAAPTDEIPGGVDGG
ncbi:hypothetical protein [Streptomyces sp. YU58]|uniref:hypothetical protein n=1 Tax=Streptomyces sp. SX92 TaxID=3158972 RepID=UPI0027B8A196|nr:hypothetical protein [Streptomyces coralus]WLW55568.1 hypothetical protein QU709_31425 [Streptomyces coralus]